MAGPLQHFKAAILDAWRNRVAADLCGRKGFRGGPLLDVHGSLQLLVSSHVRERDKALLRAIVVGGVWNGFLLGHIRGQPVPCRFCGLTMMVICSGNVPFLLSLRSVNILSFMILWRWIRLLGLGAFFGMVGCLCSQVLVVLLPGLLMLLKVLLILLRLLLVGTLLD